MKRIIAGFIDYLIACFIQAILVMFFLIMPLLESGNNGDINPIIRVFIISYCSMSFLLIRDIIGKRSIGKIIMKLKIVNKIDGNDSNLSKRFLRNLTWLLGPLDIIIFLITKERLGDKIFGTNVLEK